MCCSLRIAHYTLLVACGLPCTVLCFNACLFACTVSLTIVADQTLPIIHCSFVCCMPTHRALLICYCSLQDTLFVVHCWGRIFQIIFWWMLLGNLSPKIWQKYFGEQTLICQIRLNFLQPKFCIVKLTFYISFSPHANSAASMLKSLA